MRIQIIGHMNMTTMHGKWGGGNFMAIKKYHWKEMEQSWDLDFQKY